VSKGRPCPACGSPLLGWGVVESRDPGGNREVVLERCEACGLGIVAGGDPSLEPNERGVVSVPNRRSWQAGLGGPHWGAVEPSERESYPTPDAFERLATKQGLEPQRVRQPPLGRNQLWMWQTILNGLTFHDNFATDVLAGRLRARNSKNAAAFAIDVIVTILAALPALLLSFPLELAAVVARRGGLIEADVKRLRG
jgi:hypothetical protein